MSQYKKDYRFEYVDAYKCQKELAKWQEAMQKSIIDGLMMSDKYWKQFFHDDDFEEVEKEEKIVLTNCVECKKDVTSVDDYVEIMYYKAKENSSKRKHYCKDCFSGMVGEGYMHDFDKST